MLFYLKKQKKYTVGLAPVYLRITVDGEREANASRKNGIAIPDVLPAQKRISKAYMLFLITFNRMLMKHIGISTKIGN